MGRYLEVRPNWIAHVRTVLYKWGGLHNAFVCSQISAKRIFNSLGLLILRALTGLLDLSEIMLTLSFSLSDET